VNCRATVHSLGTPLSPHPVKAFAQGGLISCKALPDLVLTNTSPRKASGNSGVRSPCLCCACAPFFVSNAVLRSPPHSLLFHPRLCTPSPCTHFHVLRCRPSPRLLSCGQRPWVPLARRRGKGELRAAAPIVMLCTDALQSQPPPCCIVHNLIPALRAQIWVQVYQQRRFS